MMYGSYWGMMLYGAGFFVLFIIGFYLLFRNGNNFLGTNNTHHDTAEEMLKKKFVSGELSKDEFQEKMNIISNKVHLNKND